MRTLLFTLLIPSSISWAGVVDGCERVTAQIKMLDANVEKTQSDFAALPGVDLHEAEWVRRYLKMLVDVDQAVRHAAMEWPATQGYSEAETMCFWTMLAPRWEKIDDDNTAALAGLMELHRWITVPKFGEAAADDAWLLAQHADKNRDFQRRVLKLLDEYLAKGDVPGRHYAYLEDRVRAYGDVVPQRFGTQGFCYAKGDWHPAPILDPERLDERRKSMGLPPYAEYKKHLDAICL